MTRLTYPCRAFPVVLAIGACCWSATSSAQSAPAAATAEPAQPTASTTDTVRLSDEQRKGVLDSITADSAAAARGELTESERIDRGIHGEVGVMIGSYGTRGIYGTANVPLGDSAEATVSVESSRFGYKRR